MNTKEFNESLSAPEQPPLVTFSQFKKEHENNVASSHFDRALTEIKSVKIDARCVTAYFAKNKSIELLFNGDYKKYDKDKNMTSIKLMSTRKYKGKETSSKLCVCDITMNIERFIAVCVDIENDLMPLSYKGWHANVMDGSGRSNTAGTLGITPNFHPSNIEWCLSGQNNHHGKLIRRLYKMTGTAYRFSAHDKNLINVFYTKPKSYIIDYCQRNLIRV